MSLEKAVAIPLRLYPHTQARGWLWSWVNTHDDKVPPAQAVYLGKRGRTVGRSVTTDVRVRLAYRMKCLYTECG